MSHLVLQFRGSALFRAATDYHEARSHARAAQLAVLTLETPILNGSEASSYDRQEDAGTNKCMLCCAARLGPGGPPLWVLQQIAAPVQPCHVHLRNKLPCCPVTVPPGKTAATHRCRTCSLCMRRWSRAATSRKTLDARQHASRYRRQRVCSACRSCCSLLPSSLHLMAQVPAQQEHYMVLNNMHNNTMVFLHSKQDTEWDRSPALRHSTSSHTLLHFHRACIAAGHTCVCYDAHRHLGCQRRRTPGVEQLWSAATTVRGIKCSAGACRAASSKAQGRILHALRLTPSA